MNKEGKSLLKAGKFFVLEITRVFEVEENEQVIGIKAHTDSDGNGRLYNLQFKIGKLI